MSKMHNRILEKLFKNFPNFCPS